MNEEGCRHIGRYISQIQRKGVTYISKELSECGIGYGQFMFLIELYRKDGIKQEELAGKLNIDKGTTARAIKKLEDNGFIIRSVDEEDKRAYKISLTDKGLAVKNRIYGVTKRWNDELTSNLTNKEVKQIIYLLEKICTR